MRLHSKFNEAETGRRPVAGSRPTRPDDGRAERMNGMCKLCDNYDFGGVGYDFCYGENHPTIYFPSQLGNVREAERFKFCPACGKKLGKANFKSIEEGK